MRQHTFLMASVVCAVTLAAGSMVQAQVVLQNDGFNGEGQVGCQGGFVSGEIGASRFVAQEYPVTLQKARVLFSGNTEGVERTVHVKVWQETTPPGDTPGTMVADLELQMTASNSEFNEVDFTSEGLVFDGPFRVGVEFSHSGFPAICRDDDGTNNYPDRNFIYAEGLGWQKSLAFGVLGDWIIRAEVQPAGGGNNGANNGGNNGGNNDNNGNNNDVGDLFINSVSPGTGPADADTTLTISGMGFDNQTSFRVGSATLTNLAFTSSTSVMGTLPANSLPAGSYDIIAARGAGEMFVYTDGFTVTQGGGGEEPAMFSVSAVAPTSATAGQSVQVTIVGSGFVPGQPVTARIGSFALEGATVATESTILGTLPTNIPAGTYDVIVSLGTGAQMQTATLPSGFTVLAAASSGGGDGCSAVPGDQQATWPGLGLLLLGLWWLGRRR